MSILIKNGWIITCDNKGTEYKRGHLIIEKGFISDIISGETDVTKSFTRIIDATNKIVMPGLVNGHYHSPYNLVRSTIENLPLETWQPYSMTERQVMNVEDIYVSALFGCIEMIKSGTTTVLDHLHTDFGYEGLEAAMCAYKEAGMRVVIAPMISDKSHIDTLPIETGKIPDELKQIKEEGNVSSDQLTDMTVQLLKKWQGKDERLNVMFGPSGPQRCTDELLKKCVKLAEEYNTGVHTHVLETKIQERTAQYLYGKPMVQHLVDLGYLNERSSMAHGVWVTDKEIELSAEKGATLIHNPASNLILGSGIAPINKYRSMGVNIGLGTDSVNCNGNLNMFDTMKLAATLHKVSEPNPDKWITSHEVLRMATYNTAQALIMEKEIGSLEIGKRADIVILNPENSAALIPMQNLVWQIVYGESGAGVETVLVQGKIVLEQGLICTLDEKKVYREVQTRADRIAEESSVKKKSAAKQSNLLRKLLFEDKTSKENN